MNRMKRVRLFLGGLLTILYAAILFTAGEAGYRVVVALISLSLLVRGANYLIYYLRMARHMVGGKSILFNGIIALDLGLFASTLTNVPPVYIMLYLMATHLYSGAVDVMHALEAKRLGSHWRLSFSYGAANILLAGLCAFSLNAPERLAMIYAGGLFYTGCLRIASAFRRSAIAYIP